MKIEILACINDEHIKFLQSGQISKYTFPMPRKEAHKKKITHLIIRFFIMAITPEKEILYLVQKRGKNKQSFPEHFTDSASGHVNYKADLEFNDIKKNAIRELEEEFNIPPKTIQNIIFYNIIIEKDEFTTEVAYVFFGLIDYDVKLNPNPSELEVDASRFYTKVELEKLLESEKSVDYSKKIWEYLLNLNVLKIFEEEKELKDGNEKKIALFIGRFQPIHHGHIYVLKNILKSYDLLKIGIGSSQLSHTKNDPFTSDERKQFLNAVLKKREISPDLYNIYEITDIFNAKKWVDHVISIVGEFDVIFSNSNWVRQLFQTKGIKIGKKITIFKSKFNATNIRKLIIKDNRGWLRLVPKEVVNLIKKFNGIERIKLLFEKEEES